MPIINVFAVLVAALSNFVLGGIWYSLLFTKQWQKLSGVTDSQLKKSSAKIFTLSFLVSIVMAFNLAAFIGPDATLGFSTMAGFLAGFGWVAMALGMNYLFERKPLGLYLINASYNVLAFTLMGFILGSM